MAATAWKGYISFGLVSIPISLTPAARSERISFHQLHKVCHTRLKQPLFCPHCNRIVERSEVEKGYEYAKDEYVLFTPDEIKQIEPQSAHSMDILEFVKLDEIDPLYFDASYYIAPLEPGVHAYHLLMDAMHKSGYAGIAKVTMHNREYTAIIRARENGLALHTMFYANEIREANDLGNKDKAEIKEQEETLAMQLIKNLAAPFKPEKYRDTYQEVLQGLIEAKTHGKTIAATPHKKPAPVIDLMAALKKSLSQKAAPAREPKPLIHAVPKRGEEEHRKRRKAS
ncbi:MAG: Ku protein [Candidatus Acidiferrales bacterium]